MIRPLIFILIVVFIAGAITVLAGIDGWIEAEAFGAKFDVYAGGAAVALLVALVIAVALTSAYKDVRRLPRDLNVRRREARRARGVEAVASGLEAVAVGDAAGAQRCARIARRNLDESALTRLLTAQAAHLSGDEAAAKENFTLMLEAPETEFLGLRGLYLQARRADDKEAARNYAARAFSLRPNAAWAFDSVLALGLERGAWRETREAIGTAQKHGIIPADNARRGAAALLAADAYAAAAAGDRALAIKDADAAVKLAPAFAPAAVLAARLQAATGRKARAAKILEQAFAVEPHQALAVAHQELFAEEPVEKRAQQLQRLADRRPDSREGVLARVRSDLAVGARAEAARRLEPLLLRAATAREYALMAETVDGDSPGGDAAARHWLKRAAGAPRDPTPGADGVFHFTREGWARLVREYMEYGRLAPPPLENGPPGLSESELKQLSAPAAVAPAGSETGDLSVPERDAEGPAGESESANLLAARIVSAAGEVS